MGEHSSVTMMYKDWFVSLCRGYGGGCRESYILKIECTSEH